MSYGFHEEQLSNFPLLLSGSTPCRHQSQHRTFLETEARGVGHFPTAQTGEHNEAWASSSVTAYKGLLLREIVISPSYL